ncbi:MAG: hypothetical protein RRY23_04990 [Alistipes sp.]
MRNLLPPPYGQFYLHWRVISADTSFAKGLFGLYLHINRHKNLVIVRLGTKEGSTNRINYFAATCSTDHRTETLNPRFCQEVGKFA